MAVGAWLRLDGVHWDGDHHLHPDERYMTMVAGAVDFPRSLGEYFDVGASPLSPYNHDVGQSYLYGTLPLNATKLAARATGRDDYEGLTVVGRRLSAIVDVLAIGVVFLLARRMLSGVRGAAARAAPVLAAAFYALAVLPLQQAHFFTVDSWLALASLLVLLQAQRVVAADRGWTRAGRLAVLGVTVGIALSCKLSALALAAPVALALVWGMPRPSTLRQAAATAADVALEGLLVVVCGYATFRLLSPYAFADSSWFDLRIAPELSAALDLQRSAVSGDALPPPNIQWLNSTPWLTPLANLALWGLGGAVGAAAVAGTVMIGLEAARAGARWLRGRTPRAPTAAAALAAVFAIVLFALSASRFAHPLRYLLPLAGGLCALAAVALVRLHATRPRLAAVVACLMLAVSASWASAYSSIYRRPHTRVAASEWIHANVPAQATIAVEAWDDALPLPVTARQYEFAELPVFDDDSPDKVRVLHDRLERADVYAISSPRAWWTVGRLPDRYPVMTRFYRELFAGRLGFRHVATFRSEPELFGIVVSDAAAEEALWVYDHPRVELFSRRRSLSLSEFAAQLAAPRH
jgi:hypothetical protein